MNEKVPLEQAKVFRAVDPETSYSTYNAEKLVTFKLINGLAQVIPVTVVAKDLIEMLRFIGDKTLVTQQVENIGETSFWDSNENSSTMAESNKRDLESAIKLFGAEELDDKPQKTESDEEVADDEHADTLRSNLRSNNHVNQSTEPIDSDVPATNTEAAETTTNEATNTTQNTNNAEGSTGSGSTLANPESLLGFAVTDEDDNLDDLDRKASEDLANAAKQQNNAIIDKRAEQILAERQAYIDDSSIDDQVIADLNKQKTRTPEERRAAHQKWAEEALNSNKTRTIS